MHQPMEHPSQTPSTSFYRTQESRDIGGLVIPLRVRLNGAPCITGWKLSIESQEDVSTHGTFISNTLNLLFTFQSGANISPSVSGIRRHCMPLNSGIPGSCRKTLSSVKLSIAAMMLQACDHWCFTPSTLSTV